MLEPPQPHSPRGLLALALVAALAGCGLQAQPVDGSVKVKVDRGNLGATDLASVALTVGGTDFAPFSIELPVESAERGISVTGVPVGAGRFFQVEGFDALHRLTYRGATQADVLAGRPSVLVIVLQPVATPPGFANSAPNIDLITLTKDVVPVSGAVELTVAAHDADGALAAIAWAASCGAFSSDPRAPVVTWTAPAVPGTCSVTVSASDGQGTTVTVVLPISVVP